MLIKISENRLVDLDAALELDYMYKGYGRPKNSDYKMKDITPQQRAYLVKVKAFHESKKEVKQVKKSNVTARKHGHGKIANLILALIILSPLFYAGYEKYVYLVTPKQILSPIVREEAVTTNEVVENVLEVKNETPEPRQWTGKGSWYGEAPEECLGCSASLTMANGERFNEDAMTVAFNELPLNTKVKVINNSNGKSVVATVTDRHGADNAEYGFRIVDMSKGLKNKINCQDLCNVTIEEIL